MNAAVIDALADVQVGINKLARMQGQNPIIEAVTRDISRVLILMGEGGPRTEPQPHERQVQTVFTQAELEFIDCFANAGVMVLMQKLVSHDQIVAVNLAPPLDRLENITAKHGLATGLAAVLKLQQLVTR